MNTTRRAAFGIAAGGLAAGHGLVQEALGQSMEYAKDNPAPQASNYSGTGTETEIANKVEQQAKHLARRKQELQDIINGKFDGYRLRELNNRAFAEAQARLNIESLKSVSDSYKHHMFIDKWREKQIKQWQDEARENLARILSGDGNFII